MKANSPPSSPPLYPPAPNLGSSTTDFWCEQERESLNWDNATQQGVISHSCFKKAGVHLPRQSGGPAVSSWVVAESEATAWGDMEKLHHGHQLVQEMG
jgi:hypothetical protein